MSHSFPIRMVVSERDLAKCAKQFREKAGVSKAVAARELRVNRGTIQQAEEYPKLSLTKLRRRMIEKYSEFSILGPVYVLKKKKKQNPND
jgi:DNA-binding XRE family transcriptional regulator